MAAAAPAPPPPNPAPPSPVQLLLSDAAPHTASSSPARLLFLPSGSVQGSCSTSPHYHLLRFFSSPPRKLEMAVGDEKKRERVVKKDVVEFQQNGHSQVVTVALYGGEELQENVPLAHLSRRSPLTMDKQSKAMENINKLLSSPKKPAGSSETQKFVSAMKVTTDATTSRGEAKSSAVIRAEEGLPVAFCKKHLPDKDTTITLEDEYGKEYNMKYIAYKTGLSAGWRQFSAVHKLQEGDVVVFQLVEPIKFKVYIIRADNLKEVDGGLSLMNLDNYPKQELGDKENPDTGVVAYNSSKRKQGKSIPIDVQKKKRTDMARLEPKPRQSSKQYENNNEEALPEVLEGFQMLEFKDVKGFENFSVIVDGVSIDAELSNEVRNKYYKLCYSQRAFLHDNLIKGMNYKLTAGIIYEIVYIADAIKVSVLATPRVEYKNWDKTLLAFEHLGMNVEFLRIRLRRLVCSAYETEDALETKGYLPYRNERNRADDEIKNMEIKLEELKGACNDFGGYIESLKNKVESNQKKVHKEVVARW